MPFYAAVATLLVVATAFVDVAAFATVVTASSSAAATAPPAVALPARGGSAITAGLALTRLPLLLGEEQVTAQAVAAGIVVNAVLYDTEDARSPCLGREC